MHIRDIAGYKLRLIFTSLVTGLLFLNGVPGFCNQSIYGRQIYVEFNEISNSYYSLQIDNSTNRPIKWYYKKPLALDYDNTVACKVPDQCYVKIKYDVQELTNLRNRTTVTLKDLGIITGPGSYLVKAVSDKDCREYRIAVRSSNGYVGYLRELIGVPFVYAPRYIKGEGHQTDNGIGADCIATLIYGKRRQGVRIPYFAPPKLYEYTIKIKEQNGDYLSEIKEGDILNFGFQTAVISFDSPPKGRLSDNDKIIHSYHSAVEEVSFSDLPYKESPFDILRWKI